MEIYRPPVVAQFQEFFAPNFRERPEAPTAATWFFGMSRRLEEALSLRSPFAYSFLSNAHPDLLGLDPEALSRKTLPPDAPLRAVLADHGFPTLKAIDSLDFRVDPAFEKALDMLLTGDSAGLKAQLKAHPHLPNARSSYGHQAGLLHYVAANGVEIYRQQVPANLPEMTRILMDAGADPDQPSRIYGGGHSIRSLIESSAHPANAGLADELLRLFPE